MRDKFIRVSLISKGKQDKTDIEKGIGAKLEWSEKPDEKQSDIRVILPDTDPEIRHDWDRQHQWWFCEQLETFYRVFAPRIQALKKEQIV